MPRVNLIQTRDDIAPEHHALFDELAALRGRVSGPSAVVLHSPGLARPWNQVSEYLHRHSVVEAPHAELAVCATAREYDCPYIWNAHVPLARTAGVSEPAIAAVRDRGAIDALPADEAAVIRYVRQLKQTNRVEPAVFEALLSGHDARWLVELTGWIGRYGALAGILNAFEVSPAAGAEPLPLTSSTMGASNAAAGAPSPSPRVTPITSREQVAEADRPVFDAVAEGRGNVRGPFSLLIYSPPLCSAILDVSNYLRFESALTPRLRELATIATAREKDCPYVWAAHAPAARKEGVDDAVIALVRGRGDTSALPQLDRDVIEYARQVLRAHRVDQALFDRLRDEQGVAWLVELTALIGHYGAVTALLNAFEMAPAVGAEALA